MKNFDLYKAIIVLSLVLIPVAGYFAYTETQRLEHATQAIRTATKSNGILERIGLLQKELESIKESAREVSGLGHQIYFERRITGSAVGDDLRTNDIIIGNEQPKPNQGKRAIDYEVDIEFKRAAKPLPLPRAFIHAVLLNCEQFSKSWRLRRISLNHEEHYKATGKKPPPKTISDNWLVRDLTFARREPSKTKKKKRKR